MNTPIYWNILDYDPDFMFAMSICGSRGPRIGSEGQPICKLLPNHVGLHMPSPADGWGQITWGAPW